MIQISLGLFCGVLLVGGGCVSVIMGIKIILMVLR